MYITDNPNNILFFSLIIIKVHFLREGRSIFSASVSLFLCLSVCLSVSLSLYLSLSIYIYIYMHVHVCECVCVYLQGYMSSTT